MITDSAKPRITALEFYVWKLKGPPVKEGDSLGESYWPCDFCGADEEDARQKRSLHTMPDVPGHRHRLYCYRCMKLADIYDLMRELRDQGDPRCRGGHADHLKLVTEWEAAWKNGETPGSASAGQRRFVGWRFKKPQGPHLTPRTRSWVHDDQDYNHLKAFLAAPDQETAQICMKHYPLTESERRKLLDCLAMAERKGTTLGALALSALEAEAKDIQEEESLERYWADRQRQLDEHLATCQDPDCDWYACRLNRGWTVEQIEADLRSTKPDLPPYPRQYFEQACWEDVMGD